ncbi:Hypothetical protein LUCI_1854 [Lucifera butyrica]|uniref:2Fe-2S ferredoxin-type domain-containing protein n=1 Tax=Lucifera butyrica TaxID=1351585 RepID=A0A498RBU9_9FIRM|nr:(2Fe-2S)-binding protein [Lucifera butyrica]VBB06618.1 Hypothetical protein LUCI_1854 [Lucifera butyrica]
MFKVEGKAVIELEVNKMKSSVCVRAADTLLHVLRRELGLTGAKPGCENGDCGACTVLIDGWPMKSCLMLAVEAVGHQITTVEGLTNSSVQSAFVSNGAFQCGYCTSGFLMVCHALISLHPDADDNRIEVWLQSNICRCTSFEEIKRAVRSLLHSG